MSLQPDVPVAGWYAMRLVKGGPMVSVRIWFGLPIIDGEEQDRSPRWCVEIDGKTTWRGELIPIAKAWPWCAKDPIAEADYRFMTSLTEWAVRHMASHPAASPRTPIDRRGKSVF